MTWSSRVTCLKIIGMETNRRDSLSFITREIFNISKSKEEIEFVKEV